jgi:hypothetical protein
VAYAVGTGGRGDAAVDVPRPRHRYRDRPVDAGQRPRRRHRDRDASPQASAGDRLLEALPGPLEAGAGLPADTTVGAWAPMGAVRGRSAGVRALDRPEDVPRGSVRERETYDDRWRRSPDVPPEL